MEALQTLPNISKVNRLVSAVSAIDLLMDYMQLNDYVVRILGQVLATANKANQNDLTAKFP